MDGEPGLLIKTTPKIVGSGAAVFGRLPDRSETLICDVDGPGRRRGSVSARVAACPEPLCPVPTWD